MVLGLSLSHNNVLEGPEIEEMVGLPTGCASEVSIWAEPCQPLGEVELVTYQGTDGANRYPRAQPGARGITHLNWWRDDLEAFAAHLRAQGVPHGSSSEMVMGYPLSQLSLRYTAKVTNWCQSCSRLF